MSEVLRKVFAYDGMNVSFARKGETVMVNATEMAKKFGETPAHWFENAETAKFITALAAARNIKPKSEIPTSLNTRELAAIFPTLVNVVKGGNVANVTQGTWMHEDVAIEFARWLSPAFAIWCNDRIKELLTIGITATPQTIESILADPSSAIRMLQELVEERKQRKAAEQQCQLAESKASLLEEITKEQAPKVAFADAVLSSPDSILVNELAKILCQRGYKTGEIRLYEQLRNEGYLCKTGSDYNLPKQEYLEMGLFEVTKGTRSGNGGILHTTRTTKVTPKGCQYFINKFIGKPQTLFTD